MKANPLVLLLASSLGLAPNTNAQVAGTQPLGVSVAESAANVAG